MMQTPHLLKQKKLAMLALVLATSLTFAACTPAQRTTVSAPTPEPTTAANPEITMPPEVQKKVQEQIAKDASAAAQTALTGTLDPATGVRTIEIEAGSFYFKPEMMRVKKGEKVKLVLKSVDMMHDFNVDELKIKIPVTKSGSTATAEFTATETGIFEYYCSVGQHRANGQTGTLIVE